MSGASSTRSQLPARPDRPRADRSSPVRPRRSAELPTKSKAVPVAPAVPERTWSEWRQSVIAWFKGEDGASFGISALIHLVFLGVLAVPVLREVQRQQDFTTVVSTSNGPAGALGPPGAMDMGLPKQEVKLEFGNLALTDMNTDVSMQTFDLKAGNDGRGKGGGNGDGGGGGRGGGDGPGGGNMAQPGNAVVVGSFAVWHVPIKADIKSAPLLGTPGDAPSRYQDYFIVIQIRLPRDKDTYRLADLSGEVVGTDLYTQKIPKGAMMQRPDGRIVRADPVKSFKVKDGVAQLLIRVPGADAFVRDTIKIQSEMLDEEQELVLTFKPSFSNAPPQ